MDTFYGAVEDITICELTLSTMDIIDGDVKDALSGFSEAHVLLLPVMEQLRANHNLPPHHDKTDGKLVDTFSIFKARLVPEGEPKRARERERERAPRVGQLARTSTRDAVPPDATSQQR